MNRTTALIALAATAAAVLVTASPAAAHDSRVQQQLAAARQATAKYHDVNAAIADGFVPPHECVELPGVGGMGYHYLNPANIMDGLLDPTKPEVVIYAAAEDGLRLVAVEYFVVDADQDLATDSDRPSLFGVAFNGPMLGHEPGMPIHYDLHVWTWLSNPNGLFAQWNPRVSCE